MSFVIFKGEKNLKELVNRLFRLPSKSAKTAKEAEDALLQANPQLKDPSKVPVGSILEVPSTAPPINASEEAPASVVRLVAATRQAQQGLAVVDQKLAEIESRAADAAEAFVSLTKSEQLRSFTKSEQFRALAAVAPDLKEQPSLLATAVRSLSNDVKKQQSARSKAISTIQAGLQSPFLPKS